MKVAIRRGPRTLDVPAWAMIVVASWAALVAAREGLGAVGWRVVPACHFRWLTDVPCPSCGGTRAVRSALVGELGRAAAMNPMLTVLAIAGGLWLIMRMGLGRSVSVHLTSRQRVAAWVAFAVLFAANWGYVIWREMAT